MNRRMMMAYIIDEQDIALLTIYFGDRLLILNRNLFDKIYNCNLDNITNKQIKWYRNGTDLNNDGNYYYSNASGVALLTGQYYVVITIAAGELIEYPDGLVVTTNTIVIGSVSYSVTVNVTNGTASGFPANYNPSLDCYGLITPNTGYYISGISVSNASHYLVPQFSGDNAVDLFLENATGNIQVNVTCSLISGANSYSITSTDANATPDINVIYENGYQELIVEGPGRDYDLDYNGITNATLEYINEITDENGNTIALELLISNPTGNVVIDVTATEIPEEEPTTISFTIDDEPYEAEDGMTWEDWCDSEYNTGGFEIDDVYVSLGNYYIDGETPTDVIIEDAAYVLAPFGGLD